MRRLLKLVQRNRGLNPPKEVFHRWNNFCDEFAPPTREGGEGTRDPKRLSEELIHRFLVDLPSAFWVNLVKKMQKEGRDAGLAEAWENFCDCNAPVRSTDARPTRDPRKLPPDFLVDFLGFILEGMGREGDMLAAITDAYQFDFELGHSKAAPERDDRRPGLRAGPGHTGRGRRHKEEASCLPPPAPPPACDATGDSSAAARTPVAEEPLDSGGGDPDHAGLARLVRLLQRGSSAAKQCWDLYCDERAPRGKGGTAVRDPRRHPSDFLREFLCYEVPVHGPSLWADAADQAMTQVPELTESWKGFSDSAVQDDLDPWLTPPLLVDFLLDGICAGHDAAALAVEGAAAECFGSGSRREGGQVGAEEGTGSDEVEDVLEELAEADAPDAQEASIGSQS